MNVSVLDNRRCELGEGPLWHPLRKQLFWFDIEGKRLLSFDRTGQLSWQFLENVSAAAWIDESHILIASETALFKFHLENGTRCDIVQLESEDPDNRSNDGRADRSGGFWIGTMNKSAKRGAGAIYRLYRGEIRTLFEGITIPNSICFTPDGGFAYFSDTAEHCLFRQALDGEGWPIGEATPFLDFSNERLQPDGAVVDRQGCIWIAQWGAARIAKHRPDGKFLSAVTLPAQQPSCPAFGGPGMATLYVTSATVGLSDPQLADGLTYAIRTGVRGQLEPRVLLH